MLKEGEGVFLAVAGQEGGIEIAGIDAGEAACLDRFRLCVGPEGEGEEADFAGAAVDADGREGEIDRQGFRAHLGVDGDAERLFLGRLDGDAELLFLGIEAPCADGALGDLGDGEARRDVEQEFGNTALCGADGEAVAGVDHAGAGEEKVGDIGEEFGLLRGDIALRRACDDGRRIRRAEDEDGSAFGGGEFIRLGDAGGLRGLEFPAGLIPADGDFPHRGGTGGDGEAFRGGGEWHFKGDHRGEAP